MLDLGLNGRIAIITGGSDGLGRAASAGPPPKSWPPRARR